MTAWPVDHVVVVLGASADAILDVIDFGDSTVAINDGWEDGVASSLRVGLDVLTRDPNWERVFVALGDQPGIPEAVPNRLIAAAEESQRPAVVPVYRYEWGNPVLFDRSMWPRLMTIEGDAGASALLHSHPEWVETVRFSDVAPQDVNTPDDVANLKPGKPRDTGRTADR